MARKQTRPNRDNTQSQPAKSEPLRPARQPAKESRPGKVTRPVKDKPAADTRPTEVTFAGLLKPLIAKATRPQDLANVQSSPLAHLDYPEELRIKDQALAQFWKHFQLPGQPEPIISSPKPRHYKTTSKRKTILRGNTLYLLLKDRKLRAQEKLCEESPLEPQEHGRIFAFLQKKISEPAFKLVAGHLNYLIIRGSYKEHCVIFNVDALNGPLVRKLKIITEHLQKLSSKITAAYIYMAPDESDYYLEDRQPSDLMQFKKLFGKSDLVVSYHQCRYSYHPTSFSKDNEAMVPKLLAVTKELLAPKSGEYLLDLYCGYGLFSHFLAPGYKQVLGVDVEGPSIRAAIANKRFNPGSGKARFLAHRITERNVEEIPFPAHHAPESIILDPPRHGPQDNVIAELALRNPRQVLLIHCGVDQTTSSIKQWKQCGYQVTRIIPLDMFPGSANLEVLILFTASKMQD